jgi:L-lactate dehydrogenase complex protein LldG
MTTSRQQIFNSIRQGLGRSELQGEALKQARERLSAHRPNCIPKRSLLPAAEQLALFKTMATEAAAEIEEIASINQLPAAVASFLKNENLDHLLMSQEQELMAQDWSSLADIRIEHRAASVGDPVSLSLAFSAIAETGTLMLLSSPQSPTTHNFMPDLHLVVLKTSNLVGPYEQAWQRLRERGKTLPRTVNMITGPSRSADIEQKLQMGAHGPKRLVIFLVNA